MTRISPPEAPLAQDGDADEAMDPYSRVMDIPMPDAADGTEAPDATSPMEVIQAGDGVPTVANKDEDEDSLTGSFTWKIESFSKAVGPKLYSDPFTVGGYHWRVLIFPRGNNSDNLSLYLDVPEAAKLPYAWQRHAKFNLKVINQVDEEKTIRKETDHMFCDKASDWGFTSFMPLADLVDPAAGFLHDDVVVVRADVQVKKVVDYWNWDSKKETGFVGLKNQGATCYMNSLLQTLYHIPYFRKSVYHMPTTENDSAASSIPLALQRLFYKLQFKDTSVSTKDLTTSFGWGPTESFEQHDVQELNRILCENLEEKMKGTAVEGTIQHLFEGHQLSFIDCINVDYKSERKEAFLDLQLDVRGCKNVYESFDKYVEVEILAKENSYQAESFGLQEARKGVKFVDFPPVLQLQLKRFDFDYERGIMTKNNDRYEFPAELDLDRDDYKYLTEDADRSVRNKYLLHSVLVHSGGIHGGHYYAFIRPQLRSNQWFKFDDERVTKESAKKAVEEQYGGEEELPSHGLGNPPSFKFTKFSNAYMLVYIRVSDIENIMCDVTKDDVAEHLQLRAAKEEEEKAIKKKNKAEEHMYTLIKVATEEDIRAQIGTTTHFDLVNYDSIKVHRVKKQTPFQDFKAQIAEELGIPVALQRYWVWAKRQNKTNRPNRPLTAVEEAQTVQQLKDSHMKMPLTELRLFLEAPVLREDLKQLPQALPERTKEDILMFFKLYDPEKETLQYVGSLYVRLSSRPTEVMGRINRLAGFPEDQPIKLFEEIKFDPNVMCEAIDKKLTFKGSQLEDGDIICFQKAAPLGVESRHRFPEVPAFMENVVNRQVVHFRKLEKPSAPDFDLELSKQHSYLDVISALAAHIGLDDPAKLRLSQHNVHTHMPRVAPFKYATNDKLYDMLRGNTSYSDILYYEVLDIPLPDLEKLKTLNVVFANSKVEEVASHQIRIPRTGTVSDLLVELRKKVELSRPDAELRVVEVIMSKIFKILPPGDPVDKISDQYWKIRAEEVPEEELQAGPQDRLLHVYHFRRDKLNKDQAILFGNPFLLVVREEETMGEVKARIKAKLGVKDEDFETWKFAYVNNKASPVYYEDQDLVLGRFPRAGSIFEAPFLGMEHADTGPKRAHVMNSIRERPVKIYN
ncbi:Ubiquitin carboxyl-terminal hydrolase [Klebsormidium nitens]|uniref:ubiquitinyl hydrolase 1 n=1 Tax=Klebsormidium nitens TaxID=105231 RepID=A0A1Y1I4S7_KLENI|nr:Ubiquitin carboxyl-terminal hydrolase [Klebsormidium nitens]|eukprot:GAQ84171.1 Ubiquitin carboxyl-terminal hydrolase [Klebsormidium nitens]